LEYTENNRFVQNITADITRMNEDQQTFTLVGRLAAYKVLLREVNRNNKNEFRATVTSGSFRVYPVSCTSSTSCPTTQQSTTPNQSTSRFAASASNNRGVPVDSSALMKPDKNLYGGKKLLVYPNPVSNNKLTLEFYSKKHTVT
jgi:hypothetical protein